MNDIGTEKQIERYAYTAEMAGGHKSTDKQANRQTKPTHRQTDKQTNKLTRKTREK